MSFLKERYISLAALVISVFSCWFTYQQCSLARHQARMHLEPEIASYIDFPDKEGLSLLIANKGNIPAVSLGVEDKIFVFNKTSRKVEIGMRSLSLVGPASTFVEALKPSDRKMIRLPIIENVENKIVIYEIFMRYFRESDMKEFYKTEYYFYEDGQRHTHEKFRKHRFYKDIMMGVRAVDFSIDKVVDKMDFLPGVVETLGKDSPK